MMLALLYKLGYLSINMLYKEIVLDLEISLIQND